MSTWKIKIKIKINKWKWSSRLVLRVTLGRANTHTQLSQHKPHEYFPHHNKIRTPTLMIKTNHNSMVSWGLKSWDLAHVETWDPCDRPLIKATHIYIQPIFHIMCLTYRKTIIFLWMRLNSDGARNIEHIPSQLNGIVHIGTHGLVSISNIACQIDAHHIPKSQLHSPKCCRWATSASSSPSGRLHSPDLGLKKFY